MIELKCKNCGGKVERDESQVFVSGDAVIVMAGHGFECQHCDSRFEPGTSHERVGGNTQIAIGSNIAQASGLGNVAIVQRGGKGAVQIGQVVAKSGGVGVGGSVGGDIVVGNKRVLFDNRR